MFHDVGAVLHERYEIEAPIGQGGMGAVYRARDRITQQVVALKQLRTDAAAGFDNQEMLTRFEGEWQLLRTLNHPRIPRMLDSFRIGDSGYYVMEFIEGKSLDQVLRDYKSAGRRFPEELLVQYTLQILDVLSYLHGLPRPLLHRDVKPQNIIVRDADSELFLVDFGLAREGGSATTKTLVGTLGYAPLEQVKGHPEERSDLYALGATLWHMLVGEQPSPFDVPPLATVRNDVHPALAEVIDRACQDNVNRRYANAAKMEMATRQALQAMTGQAPDERYEALYLEETPEVVYQGPKPLGAREFLIRAGLASASFLLLMVVLYRVKNLLREQPTPTPTVVVASVQPSSTPRPTRPQIPPPPLFEPLPNTGSIQMEPAPAEVAGFFPLPLGWRWTGYAGKVGPGTLQAPPSASAGLIARREGGANLSRFRVTFLRTQGPVNVQMGFFQKDRLVIGFVSALQGTSYVAGLQAGGGISSLLNRPWNLSPLQTLEGWRTPAGWILLDIETRQQVELPAGSDSVDGLQLVLPPAKQGQHLGLQSLDISEN